MVQTLRTDRLVLRRFTVDDADFLFDLHSRWEVQRFLGREPQVMTDRAQAVARAERYAELEHPVHGIWAITDATQGRPVGTLLLKALPASAPQDPLPPSGETEIGWHLHPDAWGHGYATEAARRGLGHAFAAGLERVLAVTHRDNAASQHVARRIGMRHRGTTEAYYSTVCELFSIERGSR